MQPGSIFDTMGLNVALTGSWLGRFECCIWVLSAHDGGQGTGQHPIRGIP